MQQSSSSDKPLSEVSLFLIMKILTFLVFLFTALASCGQGQTSEDKDAVFNLMISEICSCATDAVKISPASKAIDSCYGISLKKHFKEIDMDTITLEQKVNFSNTMSKKIWSNNFRRECWQVDNLLTQEINAAEAKKLKFDGAFVSQTKLENGQYKIVLKKLKTGDTQEFIADSKLIDEEEIKKYIPGEENVILEYEILKDKKTKRDYYHVIRASTIGAVLIEKK